MRFIIQDKITPRWGTLIRKKRREMGLTKADFGRLFGVTGQAVAYWESGETDPPGVVTWWLTDKGKKRG